MNSEPLTSRDFYGSSVVEITTLANYIARTANKHRSWNRVGDSFQAEEIIANRVIRHIQQWCGPVPECHSIQGSNWSLVISMINMDQLPADNNMDQLRAVNTWMDVASVVYPDDMRALFTPQSLRFDYWNFLAHSPRFENTENFRREMTILRLFSSEWMD